MNACGLDFGTSNSGLSIPDGKSVRLVELEGDATSIPSAAFFALEKLATDAAATYGWRPDTKRIIVWFGDAPSHDPICTQLTGLSNAIEFTTWSVDPVQVRASPVAVAFTARPPGLVGATSSL